MEGSLISLKAKILSGSVESTCAIFVCPEDNFLAKTYVNGIANSRGMVKLAIDKLSESLESKNTFTGSADTLFVLYTDKVEGDVLDYEAARNTVIVCKSVSKEIAESEDVNVYVMPKLLEWQVVDYIMDVCKGLDGQSASKLYALTGGDIYNISSKLDKIKLFPAELQQNVLKELIEDGDFVDSIQLGIFDFIKALIKRDRDTVAFILSHLDFIDVEGTGVVTLLQRNVKNMIDIKFNPRATADSLGMKQNQFNAIRYNSNLFTHGQLIDLMKFLTGIDYDLKTGRLGISNSGLVSYVTAKFFDIVR